MAITNIVDLSLINLPDGNMLPIAFGGANGTKYTAFNINDISTFTLLNGNTVLKTINGKRFAGKLFKSNISGNIDIYISKIDYSGNTLSNMDVGDEIIVGFRINYLLEGNDLLTRQITTSLTIAGSQGATYDQIWDGDPNRAYVEIRYVKTASNARKYTIYSNKEMIREVSGTISASGLDDVVTISPKTIPTSIIPATDTYLGISDIYLAYNKATDQKKTGLIGPLTVKHTFVKDLITTGNWTDKSGSSENEVLKNVVSKPTVFNSNPSTADHIKTDESGGSLKLTFEKPQVNGNLLGAQIIMGASRPTHTSAEMVVKTMEDGKVIEEKTHTFPRLPNAEKRIIHTIDPGPNQTVDPSVIEKLSLEINSKMVQVQTSPT